MGEWILADLRKPFLLCFSLFLVCVLASPAHADSAIFDLVGPRIQVKVTRDGKTLPISSVPNLETGDALWIHPDFPSDQSAHYLLIVAFLQGPTNPPPDNWFTRAETWTKEVREEGTVVTVPKNAQQALLFLVPETGGAFGTLRSAVRGKPGVFVRASQDLNLASLDRTRLDKFLDEIREASGNDPLALHQRAVLLSRSLAVKVDPECFDKPLDQQDSCLTQDTSHLALEDGHSQSLVATLTSGPYTDLAGAFSSSPIAGNGYYSPYVETAMDMVRLLSTLHTAEFQYLPALVLPKQEDLNLMLNSPPSFHNPKSVLVVGLPAVEDAHSLVLRPAILRPVDPKQAFCLQDTSLVLPTVGEPLAFSTTIAHDFVLRLQTKAGDRVNLPATADPAAGGFMIDTHALQPSEIDSEVTGTLHGSWGFESYSGPSFHLRNARSARWTIPSSDKDALVVGRQDTFHLQSDGSGGAACIEQVSLEDAAGKHLKVIWKTLQPEQLPEQLELQLPLKDEPAGDMKLLVKQFGLADPDTVTLHTYSEAAHLDHFTINAGDRQGFLSGTRLDEVGDFELNGVHFVPAKLSRAEHEDMLGLLAPSTAATVALPLDEKLIAHVTLKDGRVLDLQATVEPERPKVTLVSKSVKLAIPPSAVRLGNEDELPQDAQLSFLVKTEVPDKFPHSEKIEVATTDGSSDAFLSVAKSNLVLQDAENVLAIFDPIKDFGSSSFGPLQFRAVSEDGEKGDWLPLANLVRIPSLKEIHCPELPDQPCKLNRSQLFLLDSVASDPQFKDAISVPAGYADTMLSVPRPNGALLYVRLRDDPSSVGTMALPVFPEDH